MPPARSPDSGPGKLRRLWRSAGRPALATLALTAAVAACAALVTIHGGLYNVSATEQHTAPVYWALEAGMRNAVKRRSRDITPPELSSSALVQRGLVLHRDACVQCHGAPGVPPGDAGKGLLPVPNNLVQTAREWTAAEIYWATRYGLKMTGMPAWGMRFHDDDLWAIVAFVKHLPRLTVAEYEAMAQRASRQTRVTAPGRRDSTSASRQILPLPSGEGWGEGYAVHRPPSTLRAGDPRRGVLAMQQYACTTCHTIPGMVGANAHVGPPLAGIGDRRFLGGRLPNTPDNMVKWIRHPREISPQSLMPDLGVTEQDARDMAAYLLTLKAQP